MQEVAKRRHIEAGMVEIVVSRHRGPRVFRVPRKKAKGLLELLSDYEVEESVPASDVFPVLKDAKKKPGAMLRGARLREKFTQAGLAKTLGTSQAAISAMENGSRSIGKGMAKRLAKMLSTDYRLFL